MENRIAAAFALPLTPAERAVFAEIAGEREPPPAPVHELWAPVGRGGGKDSIASGLATYVAVSVDYKNRLRPGEKASILCLAVDRTQANIVFGYIKGYFEIVPTLAEMVERIGSGTIELTNGAEIIVATNSFRAVRGRTIVCAIYDECAFWRDESSVNPDHEVDSAVDPGMIRWPHSLKIGISTVYRRQGLLYQKWRDYFGKDDPDILVISGSSRLFNPTLPQAYIDRKMAEDPIVAGAEYFCRWRDDLSNYINRAVVEAATVVGRYELPPNPSYISSYTAFFDGAGGSGGDSAALAIAHCRDDGVVVLDAVRDTKPPFSPEKAIEEFCELLHSYGIREVSGDKWAGGFPPEQFAKRSITYEAAERPKSQIYLDFLPILNSRRVELLDNQRLISQLLSLERRVAWGGKDSIDHPKGQNWHDDLINAAAGCCVAAATGDGIDYATIEKLARRGQPTAPAPNPDEIVVDLKEPFGVPGEYWPIGRRRVSPQMADRLRAAGIID